MNPIKENNFINLIDFFSEKDIKKTLKLLTFGLILVLSLRQLGDYDLGFILKGGKWIYENNAFPTYDTYTYTVNDHKYINSHWLFQIFGYILFNYFGYSSISLVVSVIVLSCFYLSTRKENSIFISNLTLLLAAIVISFRFNFRPEILTWLYLCCYLKILSNPDNLKNNNHFILLLIQILWNNSHGLSIIGVFIYIVYLVCGYWRSLKIEKKQIKILILLILSLLATPYFIDGALFPFYLFTRLQEGNIMNNQITEFTSIFEITTTDTSPFQNINYNIVLFFILFILFLINFLKKRVPLFIFIISLFFMFLSIRSVRNMPLLIFTIIPYTSIPLNHHIKRQQIKQAAKYIYGLSIVLLIIIVSNGSFYAITRQEVKFGCGLNSSSYPYEISKYISKNLQNQNILNDFNTGSWLEWSTKSKVYIDGRLEVMREDFFEEYLTSMKPSGLQKLIDKYNSKLLVFDYMSNSGWCKQIDSLKNWEKVMIEGKYVLFLRKDMKKREMINNNSKNPVNKFTKHQKDSILEYYLNKNLNFLSKAKLALEGNLNYNYSSKCSPGIWYSRFKENNLSENYYIDFLNSSKGIYPEIFINLGSLYYNDKQYIKAYLCYKKAQIYFPNNSIITNRLELLQYDKTIIKVFEN